MFWNALILFVYLVEGATGCKGIHEAGLPKKQWDRGVVVRRNGDESPLERCSSIGEG